MTNVAQFSVQRGLTDRQKKLVCEDFLVFSCFECLLFQTVLFSLFGFLFHSWGVILEGRRKQL